MKKFLSMMMCSFIVLGTLAGCSDEGGESDGDTIKIGLNYEQSGAAATYGQDHIDGIQLAVDEINANGGIDGKKLELVIKDNKTDTNEVINVTTSLVSEDNVVAILGPATSGATKSAISVANKTKVPVVSASATTDDVTYNKDGSVTKYGFKICFSDSYQGKALAKYAVSKNYNKIVILADTNDYGKGLTKSFGEEYEKNGGTVVAVENYTSGDTDFSAVLTKIKEYDFDALFVAGYYQETGPIVRQAREAGIDKTIIGPDGFDSVDLISLAGEANLNNVYFSTHFTKVGDSKAVTDFVKKFTKEYDKEPGCFNALGYDLAYYMADAIKRCDGDVTPENITKALADSKAKFTGVTGTFTMGKDHTPEKSINVVELKDGVQVGAEEVVVE